MIIAVDFDGTCVTHEFPKVGKDIGAEPVLKELIANGHKLILWTMRSDEHPQELKSYDKEIILQMGMYLSDAELWFKERGIELWGVQSNPEQSSWTKSPKAYAHLYIDDAALGCPLTYPKPQGDYPDALNFERPHVDWAKVREYCIENGLITTTT